MRFVVLCTLPAVLLAAPARAQIDSREGIALRNEIYQLRQELKTVEDQMARGGSGSRAPAPAPQSLPSGGNDLIAQLLTRVDALEEQVRQLRGRIDETENALQQQNADLGKRIDDLAFQLNAQQAGTTAPPPPRPSASAQAPTSAPPTLPLRTPGPRTPEIALQDGNAALARHDYPAAEAAAREVLANRTSPRAYDARLLLAQALWGEKQYAQAAIAFDDTYNASRKGSHAQDALIGLAASLSAINEKTASCDTLNSLRTNFPQPRTDIAAGANAIAQKAGCR